MEHGRREFLKRLWCIVGAVAVSRYLTGLASGQEKKPRRPPGTCGGYADSNTDGVCDRSAAGRCRNASCPANQLNPNWDAVKKAGAPAGCCALWQDPEKKGSCSVSSRQANPCTCTVCPAHAQSTGGK